MRVKLLVDPGWRLIVLGGLDGRMQAPEPAKSESSEEILLKKDQTSDLSNRDDTWQFKSLDRYTRRGPMVESNLAGITSVSEPLRA
jgi:hypothetical protein